MSAIEARRQQLAGVHYRVMDRAVSNAKLGVPFNDHKLKSFIHLQELAQRLGPIDITTTFLTQLQGTVEGARRMQRAGEVMRPPRRAPSGEEAQWQGRREDDYDATAQVAATYALQLTRSLYDAASSGERTEVNPYTIDPQVNDKRPRRPIAGTAWGEIERDGIKKGMVMVTEALGIGMEVVLQQANYNKPMYQIDAPSGINGLKVDYLKSTDGRYHLLRFIVEGSLDSTAPSK